MIRTHTFSEKLRIKEKEICKVVDQSNVWRKARYFTICCSTHKIELMEVKVDWIPLEMER